MAADDAFLHARYPLFGARGNGRALRSFPSGQIPTPAGLRRALPAPAQGIYPLRIPFAAARLAGRCTFPVANRRRRTAPARGPFAVYTLRHSNRNAPQHARPLLVGRACVNPEPKALAGGTAALGLGSGGGSGGRRGRGLDDDGFFLHADNFPAAIGFHQRHVIPPPLPGRHRVAHIAPPQSLYP